MFNVNQLQGRNDPLTKCCDWRAACLSTCGISYRFCENEFEKCTRTTCGSQVDPSIRESCERSANLYKMTMKLGGCKNFEELQSSNCDCVVGETRLKKKRLAALAIFYKTHKKEFAKNKSKLNGLVEKHGKNTNKFAKLIYKMVKKYYPASIDIVVDPQQKMYEEILKNHKASGNAYNNDDLGSSNPNSKSKRSVPEETMESDNDATTTTIEIDDDGQNIQLSETNGNEIDEDLVIDLDEE